MNILWITNTPIGRLAELAGVGGGYTSGSWLFSALAEFIGDERFNLTVATVGRVKSIRTVSERGVTYCLLPGGHPFEYRHDDPVNLRHWEEVKARFQPELVHIWGTEFTQGYAALRAMKGVPSVIYMQGLLDAIARYYLSGLTRKELRQSLSFRDLLKGDWTTRVQRKYAGRARLEIDMLRLSGHVIVENRWCAAHCLALAPGAVMHFCDLNIKEEFYQARWSPDRMDPCSIMTGAANYPIKGLHMLLKALSLVVKRFPKAKLYIPGGRSPFGQPFLERLRETGYTHLIKSLIREHRLEPHVVFLGPLDSRQMAERMAVSNAFVLPSSIENHSSTLIEAMIVGTPCVASYVGGIPEYLTHEEQGLLYRFEEWEMLADHLCALFSDPKHAARLGERASQTMRSMRPAGNLRERLVSIYEKVIGQENGGTESNDM